MNIPQRPGIARSAPWPTASNPAARLMRVALLTLMASAALTAQALQISALSPQGEVAQVRQLVAKFDEAAVNFGDPKAPAPLRVSCSNAQASGGTGRWTSEREWVFDFAQDLPPGLRCIVSATPGFQSPKGVALTGRDSFSFSTGGPFVRNIRPSPYQPIDEEQYFVLQLSGPATPASLKEHVWCSVSGLGERFGVRLIEGRERDELLAALRLERAAKEQPAATVVMACERRFAPSSKVQIVYGKGVATPSGVANTVERAFNFTVREPFKASFKCERENAQSGCLPIRPMFLSFNAPVPRKLAQAIVLKSAQGSFKPVADEGNADSAVVSGIRFAGPLPENTELRIELPPGFADASNRALVNAASFPLAVRTAGQPPLAKFSAASFGVVERFAEPGATARTPALLPVTLRSVEPALRAQGLQPGVKVNEHQPQGDAEIIDWYRRVKRANAQRWESRETPLLAPALKPRSLSVPESPAGQARPFEVVGIPLAPGFHVVEIESEALGAALLTPGKNGAKRKMYVRTSALVTNLGVHFKLGRENALAWVTTLDKGKPVAGALVRVSDCRGKEVASARTDARGIAALASVPPQAPPCPRAATKARPGQEEESDDYRSAYFVSARATDAEGVEDLAFTWSDWQRGIEPWRFQFPTSLDAQPDQRAHTVLDRSLLRAGETVSMKHLLRTETGRGFGLPEAQPDKLVITHVGSGQEFVQPLQWRKTASGGLSAESSFAIPPAARLGVYQVNLRGGRSHATVEFRVEEFRLPVLEGRIAPIGDKPLVAAREVPTTVQVNYVSGGPALNLPVRVSALVRPRYLSFADHESFNFSPPRGRRDDPGRAEDEAGAQDAKLVADKLPLTLDRNGAGTVTIAGIAASGQARELLLEASYADPNGEIQTIRSTRALWPAAVVAGIKTEGWVSARQQMRFQALALDTSGRVAAGVPLSVKATARITTSSRKRMVGGFYSYDNQTEVKDLGEVCSGKSDSRGILLCETRIEQSGEVELVVTARDASGNSVQAASSVWVTRQGELWFGGEDHDRIDLLPEKKNYEPGETARLQVRMPFRFATALVTVEREGVLDSRVVQLNGEDPTVALPIKPEWGPNVYVSVLALRGRLREVPWYSFFTWGYKAPREWWTSYWYEGREYVAPTALVDLSKPAYRLGVTELRVGTAAHRIEVSVKADRDSYPVRGQARVTISAKLPGGAPAAGAEVALAAVDQALLELSPNTSWNLLEAMLQPRPWGVETSTAQMEIIGRRHYGRKAVAAGGGGGRGNTRELLDTLLLWNPRVVLDERGQAVVTVPLNDAITSFRIVAVADAQAGLFGTGQTTIRATQDLQIISGLPPLVREDDQFRAQFTLRNTTARAMKVEVNARATLLDLKPQTLDLPAGEAREVAWTVTAPAQLAATRAEALLWEVEARDTSANAGAGAGATAARDALKARQRIVPAVPLTVQQATLVQVDGPLTLDVVTPADALPGRGGLRLSLQPRLAEGLGGVRDWFAQYPFICLEQKTSKSIGLRDARLWQTVVAQMPTYLDADGLASYFPPREGDSNRGSDTLTAYILATAHEASGLNPAFSLPDAVRAPMQRGLTAFVEGRIQREFWSPRKDLDVRKLAAIEALSRYGAAHARQLSSITIAPNQWPTHAVIDWLAILRRMSDVPQREQRIAEATQVLRARLSWQGTRLVFSTERDDYWWWLMTGGDLNTARLLLAALDDPAWKDDLGRLANGFIQRQQRGAWATTTANLWGGLALEKFSAKFESQPVAGSTRASLGAASAAVDWARVERIKPTDAGGEPHVAASFGAPQSPGMLRNNTALLPWPAEGKGTLAVTQQGSGKPWLTVQSVAAVALKAPFFAGYQISRTVTPVEQAVAGRYSRGDVLRISVEVNASADMSWVVISDPVPGGATILGTGLGRDSQIATQGEKRSGWAWPAFEERSFEAFRAYYEYLPKGTMKFEYTVRLNNVGEFALPPTRVEAMYAPEMFGELPNARLKVEPR